MIAFGQSFAPAKLLTVIGQAMMKSMGWVTQPFDASACWMFGATPSGLTPTPILRNWFALARNGGQLVCNVQRIAAPCVCYIGEADGVLDVAVRQGRWTMDDGRWTMDDG